MVIDMPAVSGRGAYITQIGQANEASITQTAPPMLLTSTCRDTTPGGTFQYAQNSNQQLFAIERYDLKTGECIGDRKQKLRKYEVVRRGEDIYVVGSAPELGSWEPAAAVNIPISQANIVRG